MLIVEVEVAVVEADLEVGSEEVLEICCSHLQSSGQCHDVMVVVNLGDTPYSQVRCAGLAEADLILIPGGLVAVVFEVEVFVDFHQDCCSVQIEQKVLRVVAIAQLDRYLLHRTRCRRKDFPPAP